MAIIAVTITISTIYTTALADTTGYTGSKATTATAVIILLQKLDAVQVDKLRKLIDNCKIPRRLCDPLPPVILFYHVSLQPTSGNIKQQSQEGRGHRLYVGIRHP